MIYYSIVPMEMVFNENKNEYNYAEVDYLGQKVIVSHLSGSRYVINRVISTQLKAYLDPRLQPGTVINADLP